MQAGTGVGNQARQLSLAIACPASPPPDRTILNREAIMNYRKDMQIDTVSLNPATPMREATP